MQKNGIQNFVCSFILSMLAIVCADKFVLHSPQNIFKNPAPKYIETPDISLFSEPIETKKKTFDAVSEPAPITAQDEAQTPEITFQEASESLLPPPPANTATELAQAHAIVLEDTTPTDSKIVYEGEPDDEEIIPLEQGEPVTHQSIQSADFAALTPLNFLSKPVYHSNLVEDNDLSLAAQTKALEEADADQETPWVVASANRYAKNQLAVETFAEFEPVVTPEPKDETEPEPEQDSKQDLEPEPEEEVHLEELPDEELAQIEETFKPKLLQKPDESSQTAYKMIQNLLIPIPDEIMNDADLTPQLSYSPHEEKIDGTPTAPEPEDNEMSEEDKDSGLFKSITSWFSKKENDDKTSENSDGNSATALVQPPSQGRRRKGQVVPPPLAAQENAIMPAELRLSFQPNRAEISGQSLQWIRAFADNARDHDDVFLEVRVDTNGSINLQKKRLKLLSKIFADRGVDFRKINVIATTREPNSLIIRNIRFKQEQQNKRTKSSSVAPPRTYY